jgi:hypothetical protein
MIRIFYMLSMGALAAFGQGLPDPAFDRIPFEQWLKGGGEGHIRWSMRSSRPATLTIHQRMVVRFTIEVAGVEFVKRTGQGRLVAFLEIRDRENRTYRMHSQIEFKELNNPNDLAAVTVSMGSYMTPGDYHVTAAIYDTETQEHSLKRQTLHVPPPAHDPLPDSWRDVPHVEFLDPPDRPDVWYLPEIKSRLHLPLTTAQPVRIEVLMNESPSEAVGSRVGQATRRNMGFLIPALKVMSQIEVGNGSLNVAMLDLERRKVSFAQQQVHTLDWPRLRAALVEDNPNLIDVHALENHEQNAQFFVSEVRKRLESAESKGDARPARVLIVLSGPMTFPKGQDLHPIEATPEPGSHVYYIRYNPPVPVSRGLSPGVPGPRGNRGGSASAPGISMPRRIESTQDSLEGTLKPLAPRLFDVSTPIDFRKALASIISEISQLK